MPSMHKALGASQASQETAMTTYASNPGTWEAKAQPIEHYCLQCEFKASLGIKRPSLKH